MHPSYIRIILSLFYIASLSAQSAFETEYKNLLCITPSNYQMNVSSLSPGIFCDSTDNTDYNLASFSAYMFYKNFNPIKKIIWKCSCLNVSNDCYDPVIGSNRKRTSLALCNLDINTCIYHLNHKTDKDVQLLQEFDVYPENKYECSWGSLEFSFYQIYQFRRVLIETDSSNDYRSVETVILKEEIPNGFQINGDHAYIWDEQYLSNHQLQDSYRYLSKDNWTIINKFESYLFFNNQFAVEFTPIGNSPTTIQYKTLTHNTTIQQVCVLSIKGVIDLVPINHKITSLGFSPFFETELMSELKKCIVFNNVINAIKFLQAQNYTIDLSYLIAAQSLVISNLQASRLELKFNTTFSKLCSNINLLLDRTSHLQFTEVVFAEAISSMIYYNAHFEALGISSYNCTVYSMTMEQIVQNVSTTQIYLNTDDHFTTTESNYLCYIPLYRLLIYCNTLSYAQKSFLKKSLKHLYSQKNTETITTMLNIIPGQFECNQCVDTLGRLHLDPEDRKKLLYLNQLAARIQTSQKYNEDIKDSHNYINHETTFIQMISNKLFSINKWCEETFGIFAIIPQLILYVCAISVITYSLHKSISFLYFCCKCGVQVTEDELEMNIKSKDKSKQYGIL